MKIKTCLFCNRDFIAEKSAQKVCVSCAVSHRNAYLKTYQRAKRLEKNQKRYSGLEYTNTKERLQEIKDKYKNGVTYRMIMEML